MFEFLKKKIMKITEKLTKKIEEVPKKTKEVVKKITVKKISKKDIEPVLNDLELGLIEVDVAFEVAEKIKEDITKSLVGKEVKYRNIKKYIQESFKKSLLEILTIPDIDLKNLVKKCKKESRPCILLFLGFNGSGKTTSIAKTAYWLQKNGYTCVFGAGDSFRAASVEQLEEHGKNIKVKTIKQKYGSDPAAIIYDSVEYAKANKINVVLADTAGRTHTNKNLMEELKKICRVNEPDLKILVLDSLVGNDAVLQAKMFDEAVGVDAIIFTKADVNEKGGAILSVAYTIKKPILFIGTGQKYDDFEKFSREKFVKNLIGY